jgi:replicative DNA helicase
MEVTRRAFPSSNFDDEPSFTPNTIRLGSKINDGGPGPVPFPKSNFGNEDPPF